MPRGLSVAGFDNLVEAQRDELTTYDFNNPALAHAMLWFILNPPRTRAEKAQVRMEMPGMLVPRATTGPARTA